MADLTTDDLLEAKREGVRLAREVVMPHLQTAEQWRYDRVAWSLAILLGEIPADTPEPLISTPTRIGFSPNVV